MKNAVIQSNARKSAILAQFLILLSVFMLLVGFSTICPTKNTNIVTICKAGNTGEEANPTNNSGSTYTKGTLFSDSSLAQGVTAFSNLYCNKLFLILLIIDLIFFAFFHDQRAKEIEKKAALGVCAVYILCKFAEAGVVTSTLDVIAGWFGA